MKEFNENPVLPSAGIKTDYKINAVLETENAENISSRYLSK